MSVHLRLQLWQHFVNSCDSSLSAARTALFLQLGQLFIYSCDGYLSAAVTALYPFKAVTTLYLITAAVKARYLLL